MVSIASAQGKCWYPICVGVRLKAFPCLQSLTVSVVYTLTVCQATDLELSIVPIVIGTNINTAGPSGLRCFSCSCHEPSCRSSSGFSFDFMSLRHVLSDLCRGLVVGLSLPAVFHCLALYSSRRSNLLGVVDRSVCYWY
jgi:hypothetical protein